MYKTKRCTESLSVRIQPEVSRCLESVAKGQGVTKSTLVKTILGDYVKMKRELLQHMLDSMTDDEKKKLVKEMSYEVITSA